MDAEADGEVVLTAVNQRRRGKPLKTADEGI
jgi:hypothetical protein